MVFVINYKYKTGRRWMKNRVLENEKVIQCVYFVIHCISVCYDGAFFLYEKRVETLRRSGWNSTRNGPILVEQCMESFWYFTRLINQGKSACFYCIKVLLQSFTELHRVLFIWFITIKTWWNSVWLCGELYAK